MSREHNDKPIDAVPGLWELTLLGKTDIERVDR